MMPLGICNIDPATGNVYSVGCAHYAVVTTTGTTTIKNGGGVYYGVNCISTGTTWTLTPYDIVVAGTTTTTTTLNATQTATNKGFQANPGPGGTGVGFLGALTIVTSGTPGIWNVLWD
jgi:hypothetical protein